MLKTKINSITTFKISSQKQVLRVAFAFINSSNKKGCPMDSLFTKYITLVLLNGDFLDKITFFSFHIQQINAFG